MPETKKISSCHCGPDPQSHWYATRIISSKTQLMHRLEIDCIRSYQTKFAPGLLFLCCSAEYSQHLNEDFWGRLFFYRNAERTQPQPIDTREMNNFMLVTSASDELINLGTVTREFLAGQRVRVKAGFFEGAEGVIKRIKGDRRLIVSIDGVTAVATCYIRPELLEAVETI